MDISNSFDLPIDAAAAWRTLLDIKRIMPCIPGAELLEASADGASYRGKVTVKLGPVTLAFMGTATFAERDEAARRARLKAKGSESRGRGGVDADMTFRVEQAGAGSHVSVLTQVRFTGAVAQYGRGIGIIQGVAAQLIGQFAANLRASLATSEVAGHSGTAEPVPPPVPKRPISAVALLWRAAWRWLSGIFGGRG